jgi:hypothetical protein
MFRILVRCGLTVAAITACSCVWIVGVAAGQAAGKPTMPKLLQTAFANGSASGSVHETESAVSGNRWFKLSDDVSLHDGRQHITRSDGVDAHVLLVGPVAYVSGNMKTLVTYFGLSRSVAQKVGIRWVRIPSSDHGWYPTVADDATLPSALSDVKPSGHLVELSASELDGQSVIGIRGSMPERFKGGGTDTIFLTRSAHPMLVAASFAGSGQKVTNTFSQWGERVTTSPPTNWIASSKL